ncbi:PREDICTED: uncharacterized protein LOC107092915 [Cyprinodon variegatus]|uniref:uncharacterized protein LOC107092915 n=1 Tax=Cyprinodon variegatus TaxID=28743 RepID=UPI0007429FA7|nr:PREDICTED: uncharacterized protein LOC107092915 [Cyprinodon variegatus]
MRYFSGSARDLKAAVKYCLPVLERGRQDGNLLRAKKERNILVKYNLCLGSKILSTAQNSNSNLLKHLQKQHAAMKLEATGTQTGSLSDATSPPFNRGTVSQDKVDKAIARYDVEDMQAISTVESPAFRRLVSMITGATQQMGWKTFSKFLEREYTKMESELKKTFEGLKYISTTADIWSAHNRSFMGITSHWINPTTLQRQKAALACKRIKGRHTYDLIAGEIDHIHSLFGVSTKVTSTVTDNGSNFVKAFAMYQLESFSDDDDEDHDDDVTFTDVAEVLNTAAEEGIVLPPHQRCASHTLNLISYSDVEKWFVSNPGTKALYKSSVTVEQGKQDYCVTMKPLTVALDILQGEENCYFGILLPTLETLMSNILEVKDSLTVATGLPEAIVQVRNNQHFCIN